MALNVIVVGGGKVGAHLAAMLVAGKHQVRIIEQDSGQAERLEAELPADLVVRGSGTDPDILERAGIRQAGVLAAVTGSDEINLVAGNLAKFEFGVPRVIARVNHPKNAWMFTPHMAVDVALNHGRSAGTPHRRGDVGGRHRDAAQVAPRGSIRWSRRKWRPGPSPSESESAISTCPAIACWPR